MVTLHHCFAPVVRADTAVLVVGSLPGAKSLAAGRYYAHPRNQFWQLTGAVIGVDLVSLSYQARLAALLDAGIGLWDTIAAAHRSGSLDADIRLHAASDLAGLAAGLPRLTAIGFNGGTAAQVGRRQLSGATIELIDLPSSSPAYTLPLAEKRTRWLALRDYLPAR